MPSVVRVTLATSRPSFSCALCTYNGASYLRTQLESIAAQTRAVDEIVVGDDGSRDGTLDIVDDFARTAAVPVPVRVLEPAGRRLGSTANFERVIAACTGDVILLSDQDDIWHPDKVSIFERRFQEQPVPGLVFSDAAAVGPDLEPLGYTAWQAVDLRDRDKRALRSGKALELLLRRPLVTGATLAFAATHRDVVLPFPDVIKGDRPVMIHDGWIATAVAAVASIDLVEDALVQYRQHPDQQIGLSPDRLPSAWPSRRASARGARQGEIDVLDRVSQVLSVLELRVPGPRVERARRGLARQRQHWVARQQLPERRISRVRPIARELVAGGYSKYSSGAVSALKDLVL